MSWFDATGFANLAKSALKEAQKTIDKALDIKEEENISSSKSKNVSPEDEADNFFATWGLKEGSEMTSSPEYETAPEKVHTPTSRLAMTASLWGSFTGSFFENPQSIAEAERSELDLKSLDEGLHNPVSQQPKKVSPFHSSFSQDSSVNLEDVESKGSWDHAHLFARLESEEAVLCDDSSVLSGFSRSKLVVESEDGDSDVRSRISSCDVDEVKHIQRDNIDEGSVEVTRRDPATISNYKYNRLSVISSESDKKSSESVEVIGSASGSEFTLSPESDTALENMGIQYLSALGPRSSLVASSPESVEVIPDTPSSVEILGESSERTSSISSPYVSPVEPLEPPNSLDFFKQSNFRQSGNVLEVKDDDTSETEKISPESVEVIPEDDDETSIADDSYTSASESTITAATILESSLCRSPHHKPFSGSLDTSSNESSMHSSSTGRTPHAESFHEGIILASDVKVNVSTEEPVKTHSVSSRLSSSSSVDNFMKPDMSSEGKLTSSASSDIRGFPTIESSGEGTIMESSSDETVISSTAAEEEPDCKQTSSLYVKTMLADAIGDVEVKVGQVQLIRDQSPISSESRSDLVKLESEHTSGHTSGDELETTTSSDIEIISSANGDSSSTQSRQSPAKLLHHSIRGRFIVPIERSDSPGDASAKTLGQKSKGHQRELSETSSGGSDDSHCGEVEKLLKRVAEMTEILEARESKLIELSRENVELHESNSDLRSQLEAVRSRAVDCQDIHRVTEEYTQRLSALERKFQQAIRDKETLRKQLDQARQDAASRLSTGELDSILAEKDEVIRELREEGEKLSKQQLQQSNIIKKLRAKEKETDNTIKNQRDQLDALSQEVERLKRSLSAKEDVERSQIEAVHQLTAKVKRNEKEISTLQSHLEEATRKSETLKESLETAYKDLSDSKKRVAGLEEELKDATHNAEASARQELMLTLEEAKNVAESEKDRLIAQLEDLRERMRVAEEEHLSREERLRQECSELVKRLERTEVRSEELTQSVSAATTPLLRQLEALQATNSTQRVSWEKQERALTAALEEAQSRLSSLTEQERSYREQCATLGARVSSLESRLGTATKELLQYKTKLDQQEAEFNQLRQNKERATIAAEALQQSMNERVNDLKREVTALQQQLAVERTAVEAEKRKTALLQDQLRDRDNILERTDGRHVAAGARGSPVLTSSRSSPTPSFGRASLSESMSGSVWPQFGDDAFETASSSGRLYNLYDSLRSGNSTSLLEGLQSQLKLRDGEVQQLQWELSRRENEKSMLTDELSQLMTRVEDQEIRLKEAEMTKVQFDDLQRKYDALLQMYGEKVEEADELKLDLEDVKEMYKTQIDQLLKKDPKNDIKES